MIKEALTFDDVLLVPQKSDFPPDTTNTKSRLSRRISLDIPIVSAAMDTVTENGLAIALAKEGGIGIIHKNMPPEKQVAEVKKVKAKKLLCGAAISVGNDSFLRAKKLLSAKVDVLVVDVAHGHFYKVAQMVKRLKKDKNFKKIDIIGGNIATAAAARDLIAAGADAVKVGVGPGSICTTRIIAGIGIPQLTAIMDVAKGVKNKVPIIADGGIRYSGDMVKALAAGASTVMLGGILASSKESPGKIITLNGKKYKIYRGMGSIGAMKKGSKDRYLQAGKKSAEMITEGVEGLVRYRGTVAEIVFQFVGGLRQGLGYCGSADIKMLQKKAEFVKITAAGIAESHPHDLEKFNTNSNYSGEKFL
ncbi:guanosine monophosphate reductase [Candidatus Parcubacteria bacterium]|nr:MAG: guanosine monophosphate reductase [Candidatus Parcubacteria bacterium]